LTKTPLIYNVSIRGAWSFVRGAKPTKASRGDGLSRQWTKVEYVADHTIFSYELL